MLENVTQSMKSTAEVAILANAYLILLPLVIKP
jgi:hypothetical protein